MPGIWKKIKEVGSMLSGIGGTVLNSFVPGAGTLLDLGVKGAMSVGDGVANTVSNYKQAKKTGQKFTFGDGVNSALAGTLGGVAQNVGLDGITSGIGALSGLLKLK
jgi:hypothetical protein